MRTLEIHETLTVTGGSVAYSVGWGIGYFFGGGAGRDLGIWIYDQTH